MEIYIVEKENIGLDEDSGTKYWQQSLIEIAGLMCFLNFINLKSEKIFKWHYKNPNAVSLLLLLVLIIT